MNGKVNKFLLAGDKFMPENDLELTTVLVLLKTKKEYKDLKKERIHNIYLSKRIRQSLFSERHGLCSF